MERRTRTAQEGKPARARHHAIPQRQAHRDLRDRGQTPLETPSSGSVNARSRTRRARSFYLRVENAVALPLINFAYLQRLWLRPVSLEQIARALSSKR